MRCRGVGGRPPPGRPFLRQLALLPGGTRKQQPNALRSAVDALLSPFLIATLAAGPLVVGGVRWVALGPAREQEVRSGTLLITYILSALPLAIAFVFMGAIVTVALVSQWEARFDLVRSFFLLMFSVAVFSITVKTVLNAQLLMRHWFGW